MLALRRSDFSSPTQSPNKRSSSPSKAMKTMNKVSNNDDNNKRELSEGEQVPAKEKCPRCESTNTKFCYYNNYNKSQPRHFCKSCKRHWTIGGVLRAVPVGGARKNKRLKTTNVNAAPSTTSTAGGEFPDHLPTLPRSEVFPLAAGSSPTSLDSLGQSSNVVDYVNEASVEVPAGVCVTAQPWESCWSWGTDDLDVLVSTTAGFSVPWDDDFEFFKP